MSVHRWRTIRPLAVLLVIGPLLASCAAPPPGRPAAANAPPAAAGQPGALAAASAPASNGEPPSLQKIAVMGSNVTYAQIAMPVAAEAGLFEKYGLEAEVIFGQRGVPALISGDVQFSTGTEDVVVANLNGANLAIIATMVPYVQHKFMVRPEIQTAADLKDKPVGISKRGSYPHTLTRIVARRGGLDPDRDLVIVEIPNTPSVVAALTAGAIAGAPIVPPFTEVAEAQGARTLYDLQQEKIEYAVANLAVDRSWAAQNQGAVPGFLRAITEAVHMVHTQPDVVADIYARWSKSEPDAATAAVRLAQQVIPLKLYPSRKAIELVTQVVADEVPAAATADPEQFYDDSYLKRLEADGFYDRLGAN